MNTVPQTETIKYFIKKTAAGFAISMFRADKEGMTDMFAELFKEEYRGIIERAAEAGLKEYTQNLIDFYYQKTYRPIN